MYAQTWYAHNKRALKFYAALVCGLQKRVNFLFWHCNLFSDSVNFGVNHVMEYYENGSQTLIFVQYATQFLSATRRY